MGKVDVTWVEGKTDRLAAALLRFGQIGFWVQLVLLIVALLLGGYVIQIVGGGIGLENALAFLGLALPLFTTFWCRVYAKLGRDLKGADKPSPSKVRNRIWIGFWASSFGVTVSLISLFGAASALLITMLANPQVGIQVSAATEGASSYSVSAIDAVSIMALLLTQTSELLVSAISLALIFLFGRATRQEAAE